MVNKAVEFGDRKAPICISLKLSNIAVLDNLMESDTIKNTSHYINKLIEADNQ